MARGHIKYLLTCQLTFLYLQIVYNELLRGELFVSLNINRGWLKASFEVVMTLFICFWIMSFTDYYTNIILRRFYAT